MLKNLKILFLFFLLFVSLSFGQTKEQINPDHLIEIDNLIVDQTISKMGKDFYDIFYSSWVTPANSPNHNIIISEKPYPGKGNLISIAINDQLVFNQFVTPRFEEIEEKVELGLRTTQNYLLNFSEIQKQINGEDLIGSGIF